MGHTEATHTHALHCDTSDITWPPQPPPGRLWALGPASLCRERHPMAQCLGLLPQQLRKWQSSLRPSPPCRAVLQQHPPLPRLLPLLVQTSRVVAPHAHHAAVPRMPSAASPASTSERARRVSGERRGGKLAPTCSSSARSSSTGGSVGGSVVSGKVPQWMPKDMRALRSM